MDVTTSNVNRRKENLIEVVLEIADLVVVLVSSPQQGMVVEDEGGSSMELSRRF